MKANLDILQLVQDVDWVVGSFLASPSGELLVYSMPPEFGEEELARTASRLVSIVRCAELCGLGVEQCDFSFSRYQLVVSRCAAGMLAVLVEAPVSRRALSMATRLVLEELPALAAALSEGGLAPSSSSRQPSVERSAQSSVERSAQSSVERSAQSVSH